jgi:hypothetical protein
MTTVQGFLLGVMVSWTPGLMILAWQLWWYPWIEFDEDDPSTFSLGTRKGDPKAAP